MKLGEYSREKTKVKVASRAQNRTRWYSFPIPLPLMYDVAKQNLKKDRRPVYRRQFEKNARSVSSEA